MAERRVIGFTLGSTRDSEDGSVPWRWKHQPRMRRHVVLVATNEPLEEGDDVPWMEERVACMACGYRWQMVGPVTVNLARLECPICHEQASKVRGAYD